MKIIVDGKKYECNKIVGRKYDMFCDAMEEIEERQKVAQNGFTREDIKVMRKVLVETFDNQFTEDEIYENMDVSDIIFKFMEIQAEIQNKLNNKIDKIQKNSQSKVKN